MPLSKGSMAGVALAAMLLVVLVAYWLNRPAFGEISDRGYDYAMALGSACNGKNADKIAKIRQMIDQSVKQGELETKEAAWLKGIADQAADGQWEQACASVRTLMQEQTQKADPLPPLD